MSHFLSRVGAFVGGALGCATAACSGTDSYQEPPGPTTDVKVMTRNLYLGADLTTVVLAPDAAQVPAAAGRLWQEVLNHDFAERAKLIASEIAAADPDLIGLQEVELFRTQSPSDFNPQNPELNASEVASDFLALLQAELRARGLSYTVALESSLIDAELPALTADQNLIDIRLTDRDVILVRESLPYTQVLAQAFAPAVEFKIGGAIPVKLPRGIVAISTEVRGAKLIFGNSHLESVGSFGQLVAPIQEAQTSELVQLFEGKNGSVVLVGDFNSRADGSGTRSYAKLTQTFRDAFSALKPSEAGYTCCTELAAESFESVERIDLILHRGRITPKDIALVGTDPAVRTARGLFASDHAGVVATLAVPLE